MPTLPGRDKLRERALNSFHEQQVPDDWEVTIYQDITPKPTTLGKKLNTMMAACDEPYIVLLDDDDWHSPSRVRRQVEPLLGDYDYTGTSKIYYHDVGKDIGWLYSGNARVWLGGMAFRRTLWDKYHFQDITQGVDTFWQQYVQKEFKAKWFDINDPALFIAAMWSGNACPKNILAQTYWKPVAKLPPFPKVFP